MQRITLVQRGVSVENNCTEVSSLKLCKCNSKVSLVLILSLCLPFALWESQLGVSTRDACCPSIAQASLAGNSCQRPNAIAVLTPRWRSTQCTVAAHSRRVRFAARALENFLRRRRTSRWGRYFNTPAKEPTGASSCRRAKTSSPEIWFMASSTSISCSVSYLVVQQRDKASPIVKVELVLDQALRVS